jgi:anti-sigma regulatory factor (Ser/Thr protein kinase)
MTPDGPPLSATAAIIEDREGCLGRRSARQTFPGRRDQVARARQFVADTLGPVPVLDEAVLLVSELCTNALLHTASGDSGTFEVSILPGRSSVRVEVRDDGSDKMPVPGSPDAGAEDGRGLELVDLIADQWGHFGDRCSRSVFFELGWKASCSRWRRPVPVLSDLRTGSITR